MIDPGETIEPADSASRLQRFLNLTRSAERHFACLDDIIRNQFVLGSVEHHHRAWRRLVAKRSVHQHSPCERHDTLIVEAFRKTGSHRRAVADFPLSLLHSNGPRRRSGDDNIVRVNAHGRSVLQKIFRGREQIFHCDIDRIVQKTGKFRLRHTAHIFEPQTIIYGNHPVALRIHLPEPWTKPGFRTGTLLEAAAEHMDNGRTLLAVLTRHLRRIRLINIHIQYASVSVCVFYGNIRFNSLCEKRC